MAKRNDIIELSSDDSSIEEIEFVQVGRPKCALRDRRNEDYHLPDIKNVKSERIYDDDDEVVTPKRIKVEKFSSETVTKVGKIPTSMTRRQGESATMNGLPFTMNGLPFTMTGLPEMAIDRLPASVDANGTQIAVNVHVNVIQQMNQTTPNAPIKRTNLRRQAARRRRRQRKSMEVQAMRAAIKKYGIPVPPLKMEFPAVKQNRGRKPTVKVEQIQRRSKAIPCKLQPTPLKSKSKISASSCSAIASSVKVKAEPK